jgi:O-antigen ligase
VSDRLKVPEQDRLKLKVPLLSRRALGIARSGAPTPRLTRSRLWPTDGHGFFLPSLLISLLFAIMILPQGLQYESAEAMPTSGDALSRFAWLFLLGGSVYVCLRHGARALGLVRTINPFILLFVGLATLSIIWSIDPSVTVRRLVRLYTILLTCIAFCISGWHPRRFQTVLRNLLTLPLLASVIFCYTLPELSIHHEAGHPELMNAWHGVTTGKNILGSLASAAIVLWLHGWMSKQVGATPALAGIGNATLCLVKSLSSTSLIATVFAVGFMLLLLRSPGILRRYMPYLIGLFATTVLIYALAVLRIVPGMDVFLTPITLFTGKDLTFTGRTDIWYVLNLHIHLRPWLGSGYGAFWVGPLPSSESYFMLQMLFFYPNEGHNGYLDVINDLGYVGGICLFGYFISYLRQALELLRIDRYQGGLYLTLIFRGFLADMSESHWFSVLSIDFVIFTLATAALARNLVQTRLERAVSRASATGPTLRMLARRMQHGRG